MDFNAAFSASSITSAVVSAATTVASAVASSLGLGSSGSSSSPGSSSGDYRREYDPYGDFNFVVEIDGLSAGAFQKCDGLSFEVDLIEYQHGLDPYPRKRRGQIKWGNIKLTKGFTTNTALWDWCAEIMNGGMARRTGAIHLLADHGDMSQPVKSFGWVNGFPVKWSGFKFDGKSSGAHLVEEIEFAVEEVLVA